jgi:hypothetical protein
MLHAIIIGVMMGWPPDWLPAPSERLPLAALQRPGLSIRRSMTRRWRQRVVNGARSATGATTRPTEPSSAMMGAGASVADPDGMKICKSRNHRFRLFFWLKSVRRLRLGNTTKRL